MKQKKIIIALLFFCVQSISTVLKAEEDLTYVPNYILVIVTNDSLLPVNGQSIVTMNECVNGVFADFHVAEYQQVFPFSRNEMLLSVFSIEYELGNNDSIINVLTQSCPGAFEEIIKVPSVDSVQVLGGYDPSDWLWQQNDLWHLENINASKAWDITKGSSDIKVAIIDTWFDADHPDLEHKLVTDYDPFNPSYQFSADCHQDHHGTGVASVAAAHTDGGGQLASIGFNTMIIPYTIETGIGSTHYLQIGQHASLVMNANILTSAASKGFWRCGYNRPGYDIGDPLYEIEKLAVKEILDNGTSIIMPAGNGYSGFRCSTGSDFTAIYPYHPNHDDRIVIVSSIGEDNKHYQVRDGDEYTHSHFAQVDLCAPGYSLLVAESTEEKAGGSCITSPWPYSGFGTGTSFATPLTAGAAALLLSVNPCLSPKGVKEILKSTTAPIADANDYPGLVGTGRLDAHAAVLAAQQYGQHPSITSNPNYFNNEYYVKDELVVEPSAHLIVTGTIRFAQGAKLIVKQGAKLTVDGGTLTNSIGCNNEFWEGIEVWGYNWANQTSVQGQVELKNGAVIENAKNGIRAWEPGNNNSGGGILNINNATFKNCQRGIEFMFYNAEESQSRIVNSDFIIDDDYIQTSYNYRPYSQISMSNIKGVEIRVNDFINQNSEFQNSNPVYYWGTGIKSIDAEYINTNNNFEGFYYGVDLNGILTLPSTEIKSNTFKSCHRGVFVRNGHFTRINTNTFEDCVAAGAHVWSSNGFELHHNTFLENNSAPLGSPAVSRGLYLDRLGNYGNGFYNNTFPDNNMASSTFGNNRGLSFDCNDFSESNLFDFIAMRNAGYSGNLLSNLGSPGEPLANFFSTPCPGYGSHLNLATNHPVVEYYHYDASSEPRLEPTCVSSKFRTIEQNDDLDENYCTTPGSPLDPKQVIGQVGTGSESDDRLSVLSSGLSGKKGVIDDLQTSIYSIVDDGETQYLLSLINDETVSSSTLAASLSGDVAPFISTEVLNASIYRDPAMHSTDLLAVLLANSPLPWEIQMDSAGIYEKLNDQDHYDSLWSYQNGISPVDSLYNSLINHENELERILSKMVITLLTDTFIVDGGRDAFDYMITYTDAEEMLMPKLRLAWQEGLESEADSILNVMGDVNEYEDIAEILNDMNAGFGEFENPMLLYTESQTFNNKVHSLAADTLKFGYEIARDIITQFEDTTFFYPLMNPEIDPAGKKAGDDYEQESIENEKKVQYPKIGSSIRLYPNPTRNEIRIAGDQSEQFKDYRILSIDGRLVKSGRLNNEKVIQAGELSPGLYVVVLLHDEGSITRKIVIE